MRRETPSKISSTREALNRQTPVSKQRVYQHLPSGAGSRTWPDGQSSGRPVAGPRLFSPISVLGPAAPAAPGNGSGPPHHLFPAGPLLPPVQARPGFGMVGCPAPRPRYKRAAHSLVALVRVAAKSSAAERRTHTYIRHGTTSQFAALDIATGAVIGKCYKQNRATEFPDFPRRSTLPCRTGGRCIW